MRNEDKNEDEVCANYNAYRSSKGWPKLPQAKLKMLYMSKLCSAALDGNICEAMKTNSCIYAHSKAELRRPK